MKIKNRIFFDTCYEIFFQRIKVIYILFLLSDRTNIDTSLSFIVFKVKGNIKIVGTKQKQLCDRCTEKEEGK
ncbi:Uncharacterized protein PRO82_001640 [Candidatus Protochlamydia amoebophila]|nr:Uncharacterized protein [Candidatus Protochlamydia amoebophila]